jgi:hypothetical protein
MKRKNGGISILTPKPRKNRFVRKISEFDVFGGYWCDRCRVFTDEPEKHRHEDPLY